MSIDTYIVDTSLRLYECNQQLMFIDALTYYSVGLKKAFDHLVEAKRASPVRLACNNMHEHVINS